MLELTGSTIGFLCKESQHRFFELQKITKIEAFAGLCLNKNYLDIVVPAFMSKYGFRILRGDNMLLIDDDSYTICAVIILSRCDIVQFNCGSQPI